MHYLQNEKYYLDFYDLLTVKRRLRIIDFWRETYKKHSGDKELKNLSEEKKLQDFNKMLGMELYFAKISEYKGKKKTIAKWVEKDRVKQDKYDNTAEPANIRCGDCKTLMLCTTKHLEDYSDEPFRVLFFFECPSCKKRKAIYDNGKEHVSKPELCAKCDKELEVTHKKRGKTITWTYKCKACGFKKTEVDDFDKKNAEWEKEKQHDKNLLKKYRKEFCLSEKEGKEGIELVEAMEVANVVQKEEAAKYSSPVFQRSLQLKNTTIVELENLLADRLEEEKYVKLSLDKPEIGQYVIVSFNVQDADSSRKNRVSSNALEKVVKDTLEDTNWRLVSNTVTYRLGYLSGQIKGFEREEDMLKLVGKKKEQRPKQKIDEEKRRKYNHHNLVQLARMFGKHEGIENMRKLRLKKEPDGFFLEVSEGPYTCCICGEYYQGNNIWWNLDGLRCRDCWRNIQEKVIPSLKHDNDGIWIKEFQLNSDYSLHPATRGKLRREGILKGRDLKRQDGSKYCTVYLVDENKEFFRKYPKKPKMKVEFVNAGDKGVQL